MSLLSKPFQVVLALLIALPLGPGGLCCCVIGSGCGQAGSDSQTVADSAPAGGSHSCCAVDPADSPTQSCSSNAMALPGSCHGVDTTTPHDGAGCACPNRDEGLVPAVANEVRLAFTGCVGLEALAEVQPLASAIEVVAASLPSETHRPPPKVRLHMTLAVFLC